jgi:hypothetical protein
MDSNDEEEHEDTKEETTCSPKHLNVEPSTFEEAVKKKEWKEAMMEKYQSIMKNDVWEIMPRPEGKSVVTSKWVCKIKHVVDGSIDKYKARFVARGFSQQEGEDYDETVCSSFQIHLY